MKLADLRQQFRPVAPEEPDRFRPCTICMWEAKRVPAKFVATGERLRVESDDVYDMVGGYTSPGPQWFDCGEHPNEPNGKVTKMEPLEAWLEAVETAVKEEERW